MAQYILAYHGGGGFKTKEEGKAHMVNWNAWTASLGAALIEPGWPAGPSKTVTASGVEDGGGSNPLSGISILEAENMDAALEMVKDCPHISIGGTIEVAEAMSMKM